MQKMKLRTGIVAAVACLMLILPGTALAQSPTADAYSGLAGQQQQGGGGSPTTTPTTTTTGTAEAVSSDVAAVPVAETTTSPSSSGSLPFTGFEVGVIALIGMALLGGGVVLYRMSRRTAPQI
jgi:cobalamin biosynthesis Mg chelatase CobN